MNKNIVIKRSEDEIDSDNEFDMLIACVGYEQRASFISKKIAHRAKLKVASAFDNNKTHSYFENLTWYEDHQFEIEEISDNDFENWCEKIINKAVNTGKNTVSLAIDISSLSRFRIAALVAAIYQNKTKKTIEVCFYYSPAQYAPAPREEGPIVVCKPVIDRFAGWSVAPERPTLVILGLGYEYNKALGALEYIEPGTVYAFKPYGEEEKYDVEMNKANIALWDSVLEENIFKYKVDQPTECYSNLESLIYGNLDIMRPILVPFGPKIFALICFFLACIYSPKVAVWRVSSGPYEPAIDRLPSGKIIHMSVEFISI